MKEAYPNRSSKFSQISRAVLKNNTLFDIESFHLQSNQEQTKSLHLFHALKSTEVTGGLTTVPSTNPSLFLADKLNIIEHF